MKPNQQQGANLVTIKETSLDKRPHRDDEAGFVAVHAARTVSLGLVPQSSRLAAKIYSLTAYLSRMIQLTISPPHRPQDDEQ